MRKSLYFTFHISYFIFDAQTHSHTNIYTSHQWCSGAGTQGMSFPHFFGDRGAYSTYAHIQWHSVTKNGGRSKQFLTTKFNSRVNRTAFGDSVCGGKHGIRGAAIRRDGECIIPM